MDVGEQHEIRGKRGDDAVPSTTRPPNNLTLKNNIQIPRTVHLK